jgi:molecular chaperone DnaK
MPADQKEKAQKEIDDLKNLLKEEKWDELKTKIDQIEAMAQQFAKDASKGSQEPPKK